MGCPKEKQLEGSYSKTVNKKCKLLKKMGDMANTDITFESVQNSLNVGISSLSTKLVANQYVPLQLAWNNCSLADNGGSNNCEADKQFCKGFVVDHKFGILKHGVKLKGMYTMDNGNGMPVAKHSRNISMGNDNGHLSVKILGVASRHQDSCQIGKDLTTKNACFACGHLKNSGLASVFMCNEHQENQNGALLSKENIMDLIKKLDRSSKLMKEPNHVSKKKYQKNLKDSNHLRRKKLKFKKHLECPWFLETHPFTRHYFF